MASMKKEDWSLAVMLALIFGIGSAVGSDASASAGPPLLHMLLVGDSLAVGLSRPLTAELARQEVELTTLAKVGTSAGYWESKIVEQCGLRRFSTIIVSLGTNDCKDAASESCREFDERVGVMVLAAAVNRGRIIFLVPSWLPSEWVTRIRKAVYSIDGIAVEAPTVVQLEGDGIHPTQAGYGVWAKDIVNSLSNMSQ